MASTFKRGKRPNYTYCISFHSLRRERRFSHHVGPDKVTANALARRVERLEVLRVSGEPLGPDMSQWLERLPVGLRDKLVQGDLIDANKAAAGQAIDRHLDGFAESLKAKGDTPKQVQDVTTRARRTLETAGVKSLADIAPAKIERAIMTIGDEGPRKLTSRAKGFYLASLNQFCNWAIRQGLMMTNPVQHLSVKLAGD